MTRYVCRDCRAQFDTPAKGQLMTSNMTLKDVCPTCGSARVTDRQVNDAVDHPTHYTTHPSGVECIEVVEHYPFNVGAAIKYLWRAGLKKIVEGQGLEDLRKARWYVDREIQRREKQNAVAARG